MEAQNILPTHFKTNTPTHLRPDTTAIQISAGAGETLRYVVIAHKRESNLKHWVTYTNDWFVQCIDSA